MFIVCIVYLLTISMAFPMHLTLHNDSDAGTALFTVNGKAVEMEMRIHLEDAARIIRAYGVQPYEGSYHFDGKWLHMTIGSIGLSGSIRSVHGDANQITTGEIFAVNVVLNRISWPIERVPYNY